jgi:hypothetical protein
VPELTRSSRFLMLLAAAALLVCKVSCTSYKLVLNPDGGVGGGDGNSDGGDAGHVDTCDGGNDISCGVLPDAGFEVCDDVGRHVTLSPLDLFVLLDVSGSMDYDEKWVAVSSAMRSFVANPDFNDLSVALQYFPLRLDCDVATYQTPAVPFALLPANRAALNASINLQRMQGGTPTVPALEGVVAYTQQYLAAQPPDAGHRAAIVLATDGYPDQSCAGLAPGGLTNTIQNVATVAGNAATGTPPIKTFVIGVGRGLEQLDLVADAGGTQTAIVVDTAGNADVQFLNALTQIRRDALDCSFQVPNVENIDPTKARVRFVPDDGTSAFGVPQVPDAMSCVQGKGWYFDDPLSPAKLTLCDSTCDAVTRGKPGQLYIEFACGVN